MGLDYKEMDRLKKKMERAAAEMPGISEECCKKIAALIIADATVNTPVSVQLDDPTGKIRSTATPGNLKGHWRASAVYELPGGGSSMTVYNPVEYASYVEYGHRQQPGRFVPILGKRLKKAWVEGRFMLTNAENKAKEAAPRLVEQVINKRLGDIFDD